MKILVLEDDPMVRMITVRFLAGIDPGFSVTEAASVAEGQELCRSKDFDLMLVDVYFPNRTGIDFLREERNAGNAALVIMITADKSPATVELALSLGAVDYLIKPFELSRFEEAIEKAVQRLAWREKETQADFDQNRFDSMMERSGWINRSAIVQGNQDPAPQEPAFESGRNPESGESGFIPEKGLGALTWRHLQEVIDHCASEFQSGEFSAAEIADRAGLARVTVRRYLETMVKEGELEMTPVYGQVGRPKHLFKKRSRSHE